MSVVKKKIRSNPWLNELNDIVRGASGGFLFGIPLLYTMEVWWIGSFAKPPQMLISLLINFIVVFLLIRTEGFRRMGKSKLVDTVMDSIETMAIGIVCTTIIMVLLREITPRTPIDEIIGKTIFESVPFSLGVAVANSALSGERNQNTNGQKPQSSNLSKQSQEAEINATFADIGATLIGSIFIAFSIAPTEEVPMLTAAITPPWLLAIMAASLLISYGIVFTSGFPNQDKRQKHEGIFQRPISETVISYLISLFAAAFMLWFFQQLNFNDPWTVWLSHTLVLGLPATIGGAAGRIVV